MFGKLALLACAMFASAGLATPVLAAGTFCQNYTAAVFANSGGDTAANEQMLITLVVTRAVMGDNSTSTLVNGIVAANSPILQYFNGSSQFRHNGATPNFLANGGNNDDYKTLAAHLVQFFGSALGCTAAGFPTYQGNSNMTYIHENMHINNAQETYFNSAVTNSMLSYGVSSSDITNDVTPFLNSFNRYPYINGTVLFPTGSPAGLTSLNQICSASDCPQVPASYSFCEKYAGTAAQGQQSTMTAIITRVVLGKSDSTPVVQGLVGTGSPITQFFNGSVQSRHNGATTPNFLANGGDNSDYMTLAAHLVQFFGAALGCNANGFPAYAGNSNMTYVHENMGITQTYETYFITQIANTAASFGVSSNDITPVGTLLSNFNRQPGSTGRNVCNQPSCTCAPGYSGTNCDNVVAPSSSSSTGPAGGGNGGGAMGVSPSAVSMAVAAIVLVAGLVL